MLQLFITILLVATAITASDKCEELDCEDYEIPMEIPETREEMLKVCKPGIEYLKCRIRYDEKCAKDKPDNKPMGQGALDIARKVCSKDTPLHEAVVDNLKCFKNLLATYQPVCKRHEASEERIQQYAKVLCKEKLINLTENEKDTRKIHECIHMMKYFACHLLIIEKKCGDVAMNASMEILQKAGPAVLSGCEDSYNFLPTIIRLRSVKEENEDSNLETLKNKLH